MKISSFKRYVFKWSLYEYKEQFQYGFENASAGNRTRASRVAGENSTTEPPMLETCW